MRTVFYATAAMVIVFVALLAGCRPSASALPGLQPPKAPLHSSLSLEQLYLATPAVAPAPPMGATAGAMPTLVPEQLLQEGAVLYTTNCAPCHRANGEGNLDRFPALAGSAFVTNQVPTPLIRTVLYGRGVMPGFAPALNATEIAAVLSYVRNSWGNEASLIQATDVVDVVP